MMKKILPGLSPILLMICLILPGFQNLNAQGTPAYLDSASIESQLDYVQNRTRIYEGFRAVREDIFQKIKRNALDSLDGTKLEIARLNSMLTERDFQIETLNSDLSRTKNERDEAIRNKDSMNFIGIQMNKALYNTILWFVILGLLVVSVALFLLFKRAHVVTSSVKHELGVMQHDFEEHKKSSREKYEKLVVSHHNEIMKLKRG